MVNAGEKKNDPISLKKLHVNTVWRHSKSFLFLIIKLIPDEAHPTLPVFLAWISSSPSWILVWLCIAYANGALGTLLSPAICFPHVSYLRSGSLDIEPEVGFRCTWMTEGVLFWQKKKEIATVENEAGWGKSKNQKITWSQIRSCIGWILWVLWSIFLKI